MNTSEAWQVGQAVLLSVGGAGALILALSSWLGKVWASRILEQDRLKYSRELEALRSTFQHDLETLKAQLGATNRKLQGEVDRAVFVSRAHFEAEFKALMGIWECIANLRSEFPILEDRPREDAARVQAWMNRAQELFPSRLAALLAAVESQTPLYPKALYDKFAELTMKAKVAHTEALVETPADAADYYGRRRAFRQEFVALAIQAQEGIRERLGQLAIVRE